MALVVCTFAFMFRDLRFGLSGFFRAFGFAMGHGLWWAFIVPAVLWIGMAYGLVALLQDPVDQLTAWVASVLQIPVDAVATEGWLGTWNAIKGFLNDARELVVGIVLRLAIGYMLYTLNKYIVLVLLSPLLAYVSERTEELVTGRAFPFSISQLLRDVWRGVLIALRNGLLEGLINIAVWIVTLMMPVLAPLSLIFLFAVSAYFYGFSMFDYVMERRRLQVGASVRAVNERLGMVLANGALFSLLMKVPLVGMCLAPPMAAIGAVLAEQARSGSDPKA